jgi:hypothetical protein
MIDELDLLKRLRPEVRSPTPEARLAAKRALDQAIADRAGGRHRFPRLVPRLGWLFPALGGLAGVLVVVGVAVVVLGVHTREPTSGSSRGGVQLVFRASPTPQVPHIGPAAMSSVVQIVRHELQAVLPGTRVSSSGDELFVRVRKPHANPRQVAKLVPFDRPRLLFYDWEANALTPTGGSVAQRLKTHDPQALRISQGAGSPGTGSMSLYPAVKLAAKQPRWSSRSNSRSAPEYFMFAAPHSAACATAARYYHVTRNPGQPCYLAGPQDTIGELDLVLPPGVSSRANGMRRVAIRQGWVVLQAVPARFGTEPAWSDPSAQYYVLKDNAALFPDDITNPRLSTDPAGQPDIQLRFTSHGGQSFQNMTAAIAKRGELLSGHGQKLFQHFAAALGAQLISAPYIDYTANPDGITPNNGAVISGGFTPDTAGELATQLRLGSVHLKLVAINNRPNQRHLANRSSQHP